MTPPFRAVVLTLFPDMFPGPLGYSLLGKALDQGLWTLKTIDFRAFARDKHRSVDDTPAGGGPGLVMRPDIAAAAIDAARAEFSGSFGTAGAADTDDRADDASRVPDPGMGAPPVIYLSPRGRPFDQERARTLAAGPGVVLMCGRFEGVDERALRRRAVEEVSVGDAVLTGGEVPAMAILDAVVRLLPGVIGDPRSLEEESFAAGLLEHPQYTRPAEWEGEPIPEVLLSGDHARVAAWRRAEALAVTQERRPDLWRAHVKRTAPLEQSDASDGRRSRRANEEG